MPDKPKVAFYWCASCGGCDEAVLDLADKVLDLLATVEIVFWPVAIDYKRQDVEAAPDGFIRVAFLTGAVRTTEQEEMAELLRRKSQVVVAFGTCAQLGGIPGLANLTDSKSILDEVYVHNATTENREGNLPAVTSHDRQNELKLPWFYNNVRTLDQVIEVDYYVPGCPPVPAIISQAIHALLSDSPPPKGTVLAPDIALCEECPRRESKPEHLAFKHFKRPHQVLIEQDRCLLAQEILCMGPATRAGCDAVCIAGNMPCTGCCGPTGRVKDQGAKLVSAIGSAIDSNDQQEIDRTLDGTPDPVGTFYRYSLAASLLRGRRPSARTNPES